MTTNLKFVARWVSALPSGRSVRLLVVLDCASGTAPAAAHTKLMDGDVADMVGVAVAAGRRC